LERKRKAKEKGASLGISLTSLSLQATWATPTVRDHKDGACQKPLAEGMVEVNALLGRQVIGVTLNGLNVLMEKRGRLNPAFSRWLMGFPPEWDVCAPTAMPSSRRSRLRSLRR
jgi:hypothetical protein